MRHFRSFLPALREQWGEIKLRIGRPFIDELTTAVGWAPDRPTPFERARVLDPSPDHAVLDAVLRDAAELFPQLKGLRPLERWAGMIDVTPDEIPVLGPVDGLPGLVIATGFSGHGFGIGPAAGYLIAELVSGQAPIVDLHPFRFARFREDDVTRLPGLEGRRSGACLRRDGNSLLRYPRAMKIATFNINNVNSRLPNLLAWLRRRRPTSSACRS